jgi:hypothetical protein
MSIKKIITGLTLSLLLSSGAANADWGDVYYCQMTNSSRITLDGEIHKYTLRTFQFKLDQTKNAMVFGDKGHFQDYVMELTENKNWPEQEAWYANDSFRKIYFDNGKLVHGSISVRGSTAFTADCDKF